MFKIIVLTLSLCALASYVSSVNAASSMSSEAEAILKQSGNIDNNNVDHLVNIVKKNKAEQCLSRVICELSSNTQSHGEAGARFARSLLKFRDSKHPEIKVYLEAMTRGTKAKNLRECTSFYPVCTHNINEIITVGNRLLTKG